MSKDQGLGIDLISPILGSSPRDLQSIEGTQWAEGDMVRKNRGHKQGTALNLGFSLTNILKLNWGQNGGLFRTWSEAKARLALLFQFPTAHQLYTNLFISVQNHVSILHKEDPTLLPSPSPHINVGGAFP